MYGSGTKDATDANTFQKHPGGARQVLPMKYNLIAMAMAAANATDPLATTVSGTIGMPSSASAIASTTTSIVPSITASATKSSGSHSVVSVILVSIARFVFSS